MKIKIWQQFSSNHSADFMMIGEFKTVEEAESAAAEINRIIEYILNSWRKNRFPYGDKITPPELEVQEQYGLKEWSTIFESDRQVSLDWISYVKDHEPVYHFRNLVFMANYGFTWVGPTPFNHILAKLGAKVAFGIPEHQGNVPNVNISFTLPDAENTIYHDIRYAYFLSPPWQMGERCKIEMPFVPDLISPPPGIKDVHIAYQLWDILIDGGYLLERFEENEEVCMQTIQAIEALGFMVEHNGRDACDIVDLIRWKLRCDNYHEFRSVERDGKRVTVGGFDLGWQSEMRDMFANFILYLEKNGCTEIEWEFIGYEDSEGRE